MTLLRFDDVSLEFGDQRILRAANFAIEANERVCLIGRNGAGKTTVFRLVTGAYDPDAGTVQRTAGLTISELPQTLPTQNDLTVRDYVSRGLDAIRRLRGEYERRSAEDLDRPALAELEAIQRRIDACDGWHIEQRVATYLSELKLPAERRLAELSGGWRRRVALATALVSQPGLLLLDEPTNHLDLVTIAWLEARVRSYTGSVLFITHDRQFLKSLATRILEIDRGRLVSWPGDYANYLRRKDKALEDEARDNARFDKKLAEEEAWIRQGIKARRTRNEGRVRALTAMREQRAARLSVAKTSRIRIGQAEDSGRKVVRLHNVSLSFDEQPVIDNLSLKIMRGDRVGLVGNNGVGKSTLLKLMLGELAPDGGTIKHGTNLSIGNFDPLREVLEPEKSVAHNVGDGRDYVSLNGRDTHIVGYLKGFDFSPKRALSPVKLLSGGERNRVILAKLFARATNLLVLDEPTNDLDIETLEVLEEQLVQYAGTLIVVSHDRQFLDNVVTSILVFERGNKIVEYVGGYSDWQRRGRELAEMDRPEPDRDSEERHARRREATPTKLSYMDQRELDALPERIEVIESDITALNAAMAEPGFFEKPYVETAPVLNELESKKAELDAATERWLELEALNEQLTGG